MGTPWYAYPVEQGFFWTPSNPAAHSGVDIAAPFGTPITAPASGTILDETFQKWGGQVDELVKLGGRTVILTWLHLSSLAGITPGTQVSAGTYLGKSGTPPPGYGSGAHIHFEETSGTLAPYEGYNPQHPTASSFPLDPTGLLASINAGGGNVSSSGTTAGPQGGSGNPLYDIPVAGGVIHAIAGFSDVPGAIAASTSAALTDVADFAHRAAFFVLAIVIILVGVWLLVEPEVKSAAGDAAKVAPLALA